MKKSPVTRAFFILYLWIFLTTTSQNIHARVDIPKTGETNSLIAGDDGDTLAGKTWPVLRFTDNADGTVTDTVTGLMWLKDADCATEAISGASTPYWSDTFQFIKDLNSNTAGIHCTDYHEIYTDWRVPNVNEITSLMRAGLIDKSISGWLNIPDNNSGRFSQPHLVATPVWTSTTSAENPDKAWIANLETGGIELANKINVNFRAHIFSAVRNSKIEVTTGILLTGQQTSYISGDDGNLKNGVPTSKVRFIKTDKGTVIDKQTGLIWIADANCASPSGATWYDALANTQASTDTPPFMINCPSYTETELEALQSWRLPNINELRSLIDYGQYNPALPSNHPFNFSNPNNTTSTTNGTINESNFWSSTSSNGLNNISSAWSIDFSNGQINSTTNKTSLANIWPVSGPIDFADISSDVSEISFGSFFANNSSDTKKITINNSGALKLTISSVSLPDSNFSIQENTCDSAVLELSDTCTIDIQFTPSSIGDHKSSLIIESDALGLNEYHIDLTGNGIDTNKEESNPNCFIATAAYGSYLSEEVTLLRAFRDKYLLKSEAGKKIVTFYYATSPPIANLIHKNEILRFITRTLLTPVIYAVKYPLMTVISLSILLIFLLSITFKKLAINETFCRILRTK